MTDTISGFSVIPRNYGHWDIIRNSSRIFCIRGGPGNYHIRDERAESVQKQKEYLKFNTVSACMAYICDTLMYELIVVEGQEPRVIKSWNI